MKINILTEADIAKILAFLQAKACATFRVRPELMTALMARVDHFAQHNGIRITRCEPSDERLGLWTGGGAAAGGLLGLALGGLVGAGFGAVAGAVTGYGCAHLRVVIEPRQAGSIDDVVIQLQLA